MNKAGRQEMCLTGTEPEEWGNKEGGGKEGRKEGRREYERAEESREEINSDSE